MSRRMRKYLRTRSRALWRASHVEAPSPAMNLANLDQSIERIGKCFTRWRRRSLVIISSIWRSARYTVNSYPKRLETVEVLRQAILSASKTNFRKQSCWRVGVPRRTSRSEPYARMTDDCPEGTRSGGKRVVASHTSHATIGRPAFGCLYRTKYS